VTRNGLQIQRRISPKEPGGLRYPTFSASTMQLSHLGDTALAASEIQLQQSREYSLAGCKADTSDDIIELGTNKGVSWQYTPGYWAYKHPAARSN